MIGKTIKSLLAGDATLVALVGTKIYPYVMNEDTTMPAVIYTIDSLSAVYTKREWVNDEILFSVYSFSKDYAQLQSVVSAVRGAVELKHTGSGTQNVNMIYLTGQDEGYDNMADVFYNKQNFSVTINTY
jgi:hypothetical protein